LRRPVLLLSSLTALALAAFGGAGDAAATVPGTNLPLTGFSHMVVDGAHNHVFITGAAGDSVIVVRNQDGSAAGTITGESGAGGMVLDGSTLYVARCGWSTIDEIDTATLAKTGSFSAPVGGICSLAEANGRLWFSNATGGGLGDVESVSLDSSHTVVDSGIGESAPLLAGSPADPDWLVIGEAQQSPVVGLVEDVTDPAHPVQLANVFDLGGGGNLQDMAISPDGEQLLTASGAPYQISAFSLPNLASAGVYPTTPYPNAVAISPDGSQIAGGSMAYYDKDVWLFNSGTSTAKATWDFGGTSDLLYPGGLAFSSDGTKLFAVSKGQNGTSVVFHVLPTVVLPKGTVTIHSSATTTTYGHAVTITAHLGTSSSNHTLSIYRRPASGGSWSLVKRGTVNSSHNLAVSVKPANDTVYHVVWAGDTAHAVTTSTATRVNVRVIMHAPALGGYATSSGYRLYHYTTACSGAAHNGCPTFGMSASPVQKNRPFTFVVQAHFSSGWKTVAHGSYSSGSTGKIAVKIYYGNSGVVGYSQRFHVSMATDATNLGATSAWTYFRVTK
jgi:hypothetical protein